MAVIKVVVAAPTATKVVRSRRVHLSDQMASLGTYRSFLLNAAFAQSQSVILGGLVGLFSGMSVLSLAEIIFWTSRAAKDAALRVARKCSGPFRAEVRSVHGHTLESILPK